VPGKEAVHHSGSTESGSDEEEKGDVASSAVAAREKV